MTRLIDADALKKSLTRGTKDYYSNIYLGMVLEDIDDAPAVEAYPFEQVQELVKLNQQFAQEIENLKRPTGEWIVTSQGDYECSNCRSPHTDALPFCPWCGADNRKKVKEE